MTIADAQESFVLRLNTINDYNRKIQEIINKYYFSKLTVQPFMIVVGLSEENIEGFYVFFNKKLLKISTFIETLDLCFKIFQVMGLKYTEACSGAGLFIQKFFYNITTKYDLKSANVSALINEIQNM